MELHEVYQTDNNLYLVVDLVQHINLHIWIEIFLQNNGSKIKIKQIIQQLLEVIFYLNTKKILFSFLMPIDVFLKIQGNDIKIIIGNFKSFLFSNQKEEMIVNFK